MPVTLKILWADDQIEISQTFHKRIIPNHSVKFVNNGEDAIRRLQSEYFDLVLLDLAMLPNKWGGLWVLEELSKLNLRVPVIMISGEGTQAETIKALRLGAKDYVLKESLENELTERIDVVITESIEERNGNLLTNFPSPISLLYSRYVTSDRSNDKLNRLIEFLEGLLRFTVIIGLSELAQFQQNLKVKETFANYLFSPSLGTWNSVRREITTQILRGYFTKINSTIDNSFISRIIETRNDMHHGGMPSESSAKKILDEYSQPLNRLLAELEQRAKLEILLTQSLRHDGKGFDVESIILKGHNITFPHQTIRSEKPVKTNHVYIVDLINSETRWIDLYPWIITELGAEPNAWRVSVFDAIRKDGKQALPDSKERLRYIDIWKNERFTSNLTSNDLFVLSTGS